MPSKAKAQAQAEVDPAEAFGAGKLGIYPGVPAEVYHAFPFPSASLMKIIHNESPLAAKSVMDGRREIASNEMDIGSGGHSMALTPERFDAEFLCATQCQATVKSTGEPCKNAGSKLWDGQWLCGSHSRGIVSQVPAGVTVLSPDDYRRVCGIHQALWANKRVRKILEAANSFELSVLWEDPATEVRMKSRLDVLCKDIGVLPDLKSCRSLRGFADQAFRLGYHLQVSAYRRCCIVSQIMVDLPTIIAVENDEPFDVAVFEPSKAFMERGVADLDRSLATYAECVRTQVWPGFSDSTVILDVPNWAR